MHSRRGSPRGRKRWRSESISLNRPRTALFGACMVVLSLAPTSGCAPSEDEALPVAGAPKSTTTPPKVVEGSLGSKDASTSLPPSQPRPLTLTLTASTSALFVPPLRGTALYPVEHSFAAQASSPSLPISWQSSDTRIAAVDASGRVTAVRAGAVVITARCLEAQATTSLSVLERARLSVTPQGAPDQTKQMDVTVRDSQGNAIALQATCDLNRLGDLAVDAIARDATGKALAVGRAEGVSLLPNQLNAVQLPLNAPRLDAVSSGGPSALVNLSGHGFSQWSKLQAGQAAPYAPGITATLGSAPVAVKALSNTAAQFRVPADAKGAGSRPLTLTIGGCPVSVPFRLVGSLQVDPRTLTVGERHQFTAAVLDTDGQAVTDAELAWSVNQGGAGTITGSGRFTANQAGTSSVTVRSGTVTGTVIVTVQ